MYIKPTFQRQLPLTLDKWNIILLVSAKRAVPISSSSVLSMISCVSKLLDYLLYIQLTNFLIIPVILYSIYYFRHDHKAARPQ